MRTIYNAINQMQMAFTQTNSSRANYFNRFCQRSNNKRMPRRGATGNPLGLSNSVCEVLDVLFRAKSFQHPVRNDLTSSTLKECSLNGICSVSLAPSLSFTCCVRDHKNTKNYFHSMQLHIPPSPNLPISPKINSSSALHSLRFSV